MVIDDLEALVHEIPLLHGKTVTIHPLTGGMTNRIYRVDAGGQAIDERHGAREALAQDQVPDGRVRVHSH